MIIDNYALEAYQTCPALYLLRIKQHYVPVRRKPALGFGGVMHNGLAEWYRTGDKGKAVMRMAETWPQGMPVDDFRTREKCVQTFLEYSSEYATENFSIIGAPDQPLIEKAFTIETGMFCECDECNMYASDDDYLSGKCSNCDKPLEPIFYGGIIDLGVDFSGKAYPVEHKTTTRMGAQWRLQFKPSNQVTGYIWALNRLTTMKCDGAILNGIGVYKAQATKFDRFITSRSDDEIKRWLNNVLLVCNQIKRSERTDTWEWRTKSCTMYGSCDFHNVHVLGTEQEMEKRLEADYIKSEWNHEERDD